MARGISAYWTWLVLGAHHESGSILSDIDLTATSANGERLTMEYRTLGDTGVRASVYSLGSVMFGSWGNNDERECSTIINRALDGGMNLIDTADVYSDGQSEQIIGKAIQARRDEVILATKFHGSMGPGPNDRGNSRLWIMRAV